VSSFSSIANRKRMNDMLKTLTLAAMISAAPVLVAGAYAQEAATQAATNDMTPAETDVLEAAVAAGGFSTLLDAAMQAGLAETLATTDDLTILAPTDEAFAAVEGLDAVLADQTLLTDVLELHVIPTKYLSADIPEGATEVATLGGETVTITNEAGAITVTTAGGSTATVVTPDIEGSNGVLHGIDAVLMP
jgi:uncharacterized surface protein with fasciclin (FAS1) repeats